MSQQPQSQGFTPAQGQPFSQGQAQSQNFAQQQQTQAQTFGQNFAQTQGQAYAQQQGQVYGQPFAQQQPQMNAQASAQTPEQIAGTALGQSQAQEEESSKKKKKKEKKERKAKKKTEMKSLVTYDKGCCGAAWADIRGTKRWFGKLLILALIDFIPILNWVIQGYALRWSRQLLLGKVEPMPKRTFCKRAFANGAMYFLVSLIVGIVTAIFSVILGLIPFVGFVLGLILTIFINMIMNFCFIRMAIFDQLGEGFSINNGFDCLRRQFGKALCIEIMPKLVIGIIIMLVVGIFSFIFVIVNGPSIYNEIMNFANQYSSWRAFEYALQTDPLVQMELAELILANVILCAPWLVGCMVLTNALGCLATLIRTRACGHFVTRYCRDWQQEPKFDVVLQCEEE